MHAFVWLPNLSSLIPSWLSLTQTLRPIGLVFSQSSTHFAYCQLLVLAHAVEFSPNMAIPWASFPLLSCETSPPSRDFSLYATATEHTMLCTVPKQSYFTSLTGRSGLGDDPLWNRWCPLPSLAHRFTLNEKYRNKVTKNCTWMWILPTHLLRGNFT